MKQLIIVLLIISSCSKVERKDGKCETVLISSKPSWSIDIANAFSDSINKYGHKMVEYKFEWLNGIAERNVLKEHHYNDSVMWAMGKMEYYSGRSHQYSEMTNP